MNSNLALAGLAAMIASFAFSVSSNADPSDVRSYCAAHKNYSGPGEESQDQLPADVKGAGASYWRCMDGKVMVCNGGATGAGCAKTLTIDARRRNAFNQFCAQHPDSNIIPAMLTVGLSSDWRCDGTKPVQMGGQPVDSLGYIKGNWRPLN